MSTPYVAFKHPDYNNLSTAWKLVRDAISGERAIKKAGVTYLPMPNATDESPANVTRYKQYKERAVWNPVTGRTLQGLLGQVFNLPPKIKLPSAVEPLLNNVDGGGVTLVQQARQALKDVLSVSRAGLLVDFPKVNGAITKLEQEEQGLYPVIKLYPTESIINWFTEVRGSRRILSLVVLEEQVYSLSDGFSRTSETQYRVLRLVNGVYQVETWTPVTGTATFATSEKITPTDAAGKPFNFIPFTFIGAIDNDVHPEDPILYDLASLNIAQYRNSADYEEACFIVGQPTPYFTGLTKNWVEDVLKGEIALGSRVAIPLPENSTAGLLQVTANTMPKEAMVHKQEQMVALGAKLIDKSMVRKTATEVQLNHISETTQLALSTENVSLAYTNALKWALQFASSESDQEILFELNTAHDLIQLDSQERIALMSEWQAGVITFEEVRHVLRRGGIARLSTEDALVAIKKENSLRQSSSPKSQSDNQ